MQRTLSILFGALLFILPFSYRFLVYDQAAYRFGNFNPWVSSFVYLPELLLLVVFGLFLWDRMKEHGLKTKLKLGWWALLPLFVLNAFLVTWWRGDWALGMFFVLRIVEAWMLYVLLLAKILPPARMVRLLLFGAAFQVLLALIQWQLNHSIGISFLGEPLIGPDVLGVAKVDLAEGTKQVRSYGTFLHPNILAAHLLVILFIAFDYLKRGPKWFWFFVLGFGVWLTQSLAALGVGVAVLFVWFFFSFEQTKKFRVGFGLAVMGFLVLVNGWFFFNSSRMDFENLSYQERLEQNVMSRDMLLANPLGVGVRNFTLEMENFSEQKLKPWEFQPVHNSYFLILNETGVHGFALFLAILFVFIYRFWKNGRTVPLLVLLLLAPFDHFLWDSFAGFMLVSLALGFFMLNNGKPEKI